LNRNFAEIAPRIAIESEARVADGHWLEVAREALATHGAVLLSGPIARPDAAEIVLEMIDGDLLDDAYWSSPRTGVAKKTFTATEIPGPRTIPLHSEMSYMRAWPRLVAFHALEVASAGGETTVCDIDALSVRLDKVLDRFRDKGVLYRRTFQESLDIPWQKAFQTTDPDEVARIADRLGMEIDWRADGILVVTHAAQGTIAAEDGRPIWFNQANLFHPSSLGPVRETLERLYGTDRLPRNVFFGDGELIDDSDLTFVQATFEALRLNMAWSKGDILILDNMRFAHGRLPFKGKRALHVAMSKRYEDTVRRPLFAAPQFNRP
jgi:hypothetical protein